ncbi:MAG: potassium-transporting ATPase subunit KdpC [Legionellaceae bacterium]|nr:potassium-transporting ATPase subunit KdpC [Legionellaceae bacterium]
MRQIKSGLLLLLLLTFITGIIYPLSITLIAKYIFPAKANGSLIKAHGKVVGSKLIGQNFTSTRYFWGRPSATPSHPYNGQESKGSNIGPSNPLLVRSVVQRIELINKSSQQDNVLIPVDLVTTSGSGLDPDISPNSAFYQSVRIAKSRGISLDIVNQLIENNIQKREFGIFGEPRVNVLSLNIALDKLGDNNA